ncbi:kinesin light chain [Colletotrichum graminicola]|nr:kinesin light chain [Colletotrichum graminicola]
MTCALSLEYDASVLAFDEIWADLENDLGKATQDPNIYTLGRIGKCNVIPVLLLDMGQVNTASASQSSRGSVPNIDDTNKVLLWDITVSNSAVKYDFGRQYPGQFTPKDTIDDSLGRPTKEIRPLLIRFEAQRKRHGLQRNIFTEFDGSPTQGYRRWL